VTFGTIDKIFGRTKETFEKIAVICVKIGENYDRTDSSALVLKNWQKIDVTSATIDAICGKTIEICGTIVRTDATTAEACGVIWLAEGTTVANRRLDTTEPAEATSSAGSVSDQQRLRYGAS
jgi:hypothetical protein